jgi:hypothetical protein
VSFGDGFRLLNEVHASHVSWAVTWHVTYDGLDVGASVVNLWLYWLLWYDALADTTACCIDHGWNVVFAASFFTGDCGLDAILGAQEMSNTAAFVLDLSWIVQLQEDVVDRFVALAVLGLDASSIDVLNVTLDALASVAACISRWTLEVLHSLCLASLSA